MFSSEHLEYLQEIAPTRVPKTILQLFNEKFNSFFTKKEFKELCNEHSITYKKRTIGNHWNKEQKDFLKTIVLTHSATECAKLLTGKFKIYRDGRSVINKCLELHLEIKKVQGQEWTEETDEFLRTTAPENSLKTCTTLFNDKFNTHCSDRVISERCKKLKVQFKKTARHVWTKIEVSRLKQLAAKNTLEKTTDLFNKEFEEDLPTQSIKNKCKSLKIKLLPPEKKWTKEKIAFLSELAKDHTLKKCMEIYNDRFGETKSKNAIKIACQKNNIKPLKKNFTLLSEHIEFLKKKGTRKTAEQCSEIFNKKFDTKLSPRKLKRHCEKIDIEFKPVLHQWTKEQLHFLKQHGFKFTLIENLMIMYKKFKAAVSTSALRIKLLEIGSRPKTMHVGIYWTPSHELYFKALDDKLSFTERLIKFNLHFKTKISEETLRYHLNPDKRKSASKSSEETESTSTTVSVEAFPPLELDSDAQVTESLENLDECEFTEENFFDQLEAYADELP